MQQNFRVGQYVLDRQLGEGGMAEVWLARNVHLGNEAAVKFLNRAYAGVEEIEHRFLNEGRRQASLSHPNIVKVYGFEYVDGHSFLILQYVEGESLEHLLARAGRLDPPEASRLAISILNGLDYAHERQMVHRDIKPSNILIDVNGFPYIGDFGIVLAINEKRVTRTGTSMGTALYMSPEQITRTSSVDRRSDIYSFGCVLYEMLTGQPPFDPPSTGDFDTDFAIKMAHVQEPPPPLRQRNSAISPEVEAVVLRCLAKNPEDRFRTCREVRDALSAAMVARPHIAVARPPEPVVVSPQRAATIVEPPRPAPTYPTSPARVRHRWMIAGAAILMQICFGGLLAYMALLRNWSRGMFVAALVWGLGALIGGFLQDRLGPRKIAIAAGVAYGIGFVTALINNGPDQRLIGLSIGALGGGMGYICALAVVAKWFPDRRGLMSGIVVASAYVLSVIVVPQRFVVNGMPAIFGIVLAVLAVAAALGLVNPPHAENVSLAGAGGAGRFPILWLMLFASALAAGLLPFLISIGSSLPISGGILIAAAGASIVCPWLSDKIGRAKFYLVLFAISFIGCVASLGHSHLDPAGLPVAILFLCGQAGIASMPAFAAGCFGTRSIGAIYGAMLLAIGAAAVFLLWFNRGIGQSGLAMAMAVAFVGAAVLAFRARRYEKPSGS